MTVQPGGASGSPLFQLGTDVTTGQAVTIDHTQLSKGTVVIGKMGSGKTTLLVNLMLEIIHSGGGVVFLDVHGDATERILAQIPLAREKDVILLDILDSAYAPGLNLVACKNPHDRTEVSYVISSVMDVFSKLFSQSQDVLRDSPYMAEVLQNTVPVFIANTNPKLTIAEVPLFLRNSAIRSRLLQQVTNPYVLDFWRSFERLSPKDQEDRVGSTIRRIENFLIDSLVADIVSQAETSIPLRRIMDESKILLVKLSRNHMLVTQLIGSVLVQQLASAAFSRSDRPEVQRKPCLLVLDEFQNFDTPVVKQLLTEGRKYGISTVVAFQVLGQLSLERRVGVSNAANMIVYQTNSEDADTFSREFTVRQASSAQEQEPISFNIIQTLLKDGHPNPEIMDFVTHVLRKLQAARQEEQEDIRPTRFSPGSSVLPVMGLTSSFLTHGLSYLFSPDSVHHSMTLMNDHIYSFLTSSDEEPPEVPVKLLGLLAPVLTFPHYFAVWYTLSQVPVDPHQTVTPGDLEQNARAMIPFLYQNFVQAKHEKEEVEKHIRQEMNSGADTMKLKRLLLKGQEADTHIENATVGMMFAGIAHLFSLLKRHQKAYPQGGTQVVYKLNNGFAYEGAMCLEKYHPRDLLEVGHYFQRYEAAPSLGKNHPEEVFQVAAICYQLEEQMYRLFTTRLNSAMRALKQQPIRTNNKLFGIPVQQPNRQISDLQRDLAQQLVNPHPYTAHVKLGTHEYVMQALQLNPSIQAGDALRERIRRSNYTLGYIRKRTDIEAEIPRRQGQLSPASLGLEPVDETAREQPDMPLIELSEEDKIAYAVWEEEKRQIIQCNGYNAAIPPFQPGQGKGRSIMNPNGYGWIYIEEVSSQPSVPNNNGSSAPAQSVKSMPHQATGQKKGTRKPKQPKRTKQEEDDV